MKLKCYIDLGEYSVKECLTCGDVKKFDTIFNSSKELVQGIVRDFFNTHLESDDFENIELWASLPGWYIWSLDSNYEPMKAWNGKCKNSINSFKWIIYHMIMNDQYLFLTDKEYMFKQYDILMKEKYNYKNKTITKYKKILRDKKMKFEEFKYYFKCLVIAFIYKEEWTNYKIYKPELDENENYFIYLYKKIMKHV